jgi:Tol biopolymer transport system component
MAMTRRKKFWIATGILLVLLGIKVVSCTMQQTANQSSLDDATKAINISSEWKSPVSLGPPINTPSWEDSPSISPDGTLLFFSRGRHDRGQQDKEVDIFYSRKVEGKWSEPAFCDFNMKSFPSSAVKAQNNETVYFASIRPGGHGQGDIYFAKRLPGGGWSKAENIGPPINTRHNESEPYVTPDGTKLYFTSERPGGMGGMDNWVSTKVGGKWTEPVNLGKPTNSPYDDLQPFVTQDGKSLYFVRMNFANAGKKVEGYHAAIRKSERVGDRWSEPIVVVSDFVGEPSLTADGKYLYFVRVTFSGGRPVDADIMVAERK